MLKQGAEIIAVHLDNRPFTDDREIDKAMVLIEHLTERYAGKVKQFLIPHDESQKEFARNCNRHLQCVLCKRMMLRVAERIAEMEGAHAIVMGDSLGQVASQTLRNIKVESQAINIPVLRPLIGWDKVEIIDTARDIGTYDISIRPGVCCTIVPKKPSTHAELGRVLAEEEKIDIDSLLENSVESALRDHDSTNVVKLQTSKLIRTLHH